ncbi:MFS transporter [Acidiferrobacter sp.]|uniref:MFS transporter n=2 Tax=Acidiferrobacter sp. TaxID=1872107 RepID=UPI0026052CE4|nr:MFS transporter [Acidiferrobacter sp.]
MESRFPHPYISSHPKWRWFILITVLIGASMSALDVSIVNVALPTLQGDFKVNMAVIEWVAMAYMLTLTIFLPLFGRLADIFGRTKMYNTGFVVFTIGSALCGLASSAGFLVGARILQAVGAGLLQANSVAIITAAFPANERGRAIGIQGAVQAIAMSIGPFVGGILISAVSWRAIFYVNVPIGIIGTFAALYCLPGSEHSGKAREKIDYLGTAFFATGLAFLVLAVNEGEAIGWTAPIILTYFALAIVLLGAFLVTELRVVHPMIDLTLFKRYAFWAGNLTGLLSYYVLFAVLFLMPFYLEQVAGYNPVLTGSILTPIPLAMAIVAPFAGHISDKYGSRLMTMWGMVVCAFATLLLIFTGRAPNMLVLIVELVILGIGMGLFTPPNNSAIMGSVPRERLGVAGGILNMMRALGLIFGVDISGVIFSSLEHSYILQHGHHITVFKDLPVTLREEAFLHGFAPVMVTLLVINIIAGLLSAAKKDLPHNGPIEHAEPIDLM